MSQQKRLRIFAGPNGSGKSTIINIVTEHSVDMGVYVNADEIKKEFQKKEFLKFEPYGLSVTEKELKDELLSSSFFHPEKQDEVSDVVFVESNKLYCRNSQYYDLISTFAADFIRNRLLGNCLKFTFETVMSHPSKIDFIKKAVESGYKTYLYFVSLENPELNIERVKARVQLLGHDVPEDKIESRYYRTMDLLFEAIKEVDKAYFFDNSGSKSVFFADYSNSVIEIFEPEKVPQWFYTYVLNKIKSH